MVAPSSSLLMSAAGGSSSLDLLAAGCSQLLVNTIVVTMRSAGVAVRVTQGSNVDGIRQLLPGSSPDLVILGFKDGHDVRAAVLLIRGVAADCSIVILADEIDSDVYMLASDLGIRDVVPAIDTTRLTMVVLREFETIRLRGELAHTRQLLADAESRCEVLTSLSQDAVSYVHDGMHVRTNPSYLKLFGISDIKQLDDTPLMDLIAPSDRMMLKETLRQLGDSHEQQTLDTKCLRKSGQIFSARLEFYPANVEGEQCTQIIIRQTAASGLPDMRPPVAEATDPLTGFLNRRSLLDHIEANFTKDKRQQPVGLVVIDLTGFTHLKTQLSLAEADNRLRKLAQALKHALAAKTISIARYSDDEFALYVTSGNPNAIAYKAMRVLSQQAAVWQEDGSMSEICVGVSNTGEEDIASARTLIKNASFALHQAEEQGGGIVLYRSFGQSITKSPGPIDSELVELINNALEQDRFRLKYQPIVSLHGDTREYYAVFLRLLDNRNVELLPSVFLDQAVRTNKLASIDRWIIKNAIKDLAKQRREGRKIVLFVTVSRASITDDSFLLWVCDCLRDARAKGSWLVFQFKEEDLLAFDEGARPLLVGLRKINCRVAMDGFSDASQSMHFLNGTNLDFVKLRPDFMRDLAVSNERQNTLREINANFEDRGLKTVATAVEDPNSLAILWNVGINYVQGFFLQKPTSSIICEYEE